MRQWILQWGLMLSLCGWGVPAWALTTIAQLDTLHALAFYSGCVISLITLVSLFYALFHFRANRLAHQKPLYHPRLSVEFMWAIIPVLIFLALVAPTVRLLA